MISPESPGKRIGFILTTLVISICLSAAAVAGLPVLGPTNWPSHSYKKGGAAPGARGQRIFRSPADASRALIGAMSTYDRQKLSGILGSEGEKTVFPVNSGAERRAVCDRFVKAYHEKHHVMKLNSREAVLRLGKEEKAFPVSLERYHGYWRFSGHTSMR
ncbi:MAG: DUF2950 family protein [Syntrophobacteraceae bacterium]|nr:DUF2950 family protein [Syntrophobacteraceae bacterium]